MPTSELNGESCFVQNACYLYVQGCIFGSHYCDVSHMFYYHYIKSLLMFHTTQLAGGAGLRCPRIAYRSTIAVPCYNFQAACNRCGQQQNSSSFLFYITAYY
uniref:Uncharacterized protein n=1 Tax=Glossina palpalis gambiensis TaxID=67801 RepID=A0A1B0AWV3_9MUSC